MLSDKNIIALHKNIHYRISNCMLWNLETTQQIIREGVGFVSISITASTETPVSVSMNPARLLWVLSRYWSITREFTRCRRRIVEGVLHENMVASRKTLIKDSLPVNGRWLDYTTPKISIMRKICINYLSTPEYRDILVSTCAITTDEIMESMDVLRKLFDAALADIRREQLISLTYEELLAAPGGADEILHKFQENLHSGFLTSNEGGEDYGHETRSAKR